MPQSGFSPQSSVLYFDAARILADAKDFDRAFARLAEGRLPSSPDLVLAGALTEGLIAAAAGQAPRAEQAFRNALQLNPSLAVAHLELGKLADAHGNREAARREYEQALAVDPMLTEARHALSRLDTGPRRR